MRRRRLLSLLAVVLATFAWADDALDPGAAVSLLYRALAYDRSLNPTDGVVVFAVVTRRGQAPGDGEAFLAAAARDAPRVTLQGAKVQLVLLPVDSVAELDARLGEDQPHVIYVASGFEGEAELVLDAAQKNSVHCVYGAPGYAATLPLGVTFRAGAARVLVRRSAARRLGMVLDPQLLKLAILQD